MADQQRNSDESTDSNEGGRGRDAGIGLVLLAAACGIGIGMLTAPEAGRQTRKRLRKRMSSLGGDMAERWESMQDVGSRAGRQARKKFSELQHEAEDRWNETHTRLADMEDHIRHFGREERSSNTGMVTAAVGLALGAGVAYFMLSDDAADARTKVREMATDLRDQATDRWQQFRRTGARATAEMKDFADENL